MNLGFGDVWKAKYRGDYVAIKKVPSRSLSDQAKDALRQEAEFMKKLAHPRIVSCFGILKSENSYCMVMELCPNGNLASFMMVNKSNTVSAETRLDFAVDIASGMNYLYKIGVIHRDLKLGNVVLDEYNRAKITDFGLSVIKSTSQTSMKLDGCGTPQYMAPESFGLAPIFSTKSDVFAFAVVLWELSHWLIAYQQVSVLEIRDAIKNGDRLVISEQVSLEIGGLITDCWNPNPKLRPSYAQILSRLKLPLNTVTEEDLGKIVETQKTRKLSVNDAKPAPKKKDVSKRMLIFALGFTSLLLLVGGIFIAVYLNSSKSAAQDLTEHFSTQTTASAGQTSPSTTTIYRTASPTATVTTIVSEESDLAYQSSDLANQSSDLTEHFSTQTTASAGQTSPSTTTIYRTASPTATVTTIVSEDNLLNRIHGITVDDDDNLYVISPHQRVVIKVSIQGDSVRLDEIADLSTDGQLGQLDQGICYFNNALYVPRWGQLTKIDLANGNMVTRFAGSNSADGIIPGQNSSARFCGAVSCTVDKEGNIYIGEHCKAIRKVNQTGYVFDINLSLPHIPNTLLVQSDTKKLLFTGWGPSSIFSLDLFTLAYWQLNADSGNGNSGMIYFELGNLYVVETLRDGVAKVESNYTLTNFAGYNYSLPQNQDGAGSLASFSYPRQIVFDSKGRLFVADQNNNAVRMITW